MSVYPTVCAHARYLGRLAAPDIAARLSKSSVLCLPIGAFEQHGPHLPLDTDTILAEAFARRVADRWGIAYDIWLLPPIAYGLSREHGWSPGTVSLPVRVLTDLILALCAELAAALPARNLLIVNGNGGNRGILEALLYEIERGHGFNACVTHPTALSTVKSGSPVPEVHGGMSETSVMMALAPDVVHMELIPNTYAPDSVSPDAVRRVVLERGTSWPWSSGDPAIASHGIIGHALRANVETGQRIVESAVEEYGRVLAELRGRSREGK